MTNKVVVLPISVECLFALSDMECSLSILHTVFHHPIVGISVRQDDLALPVWTVLLKLAFIGQIERCLQHSHPHSLTLEELSLVN
jgi:hypothetical protein